MPTGYTANIEDGISFNEFILKCAKAFGACISMRDDPLDTPIPEKFEPSNYYKERIKESKENLNKLQQMSLSDAFLESQKEYSDSIKYNKNSIKKKKDLLNKYNKMLDNVVKWIPPSNDHIELKNFMTQQINDSIKFDCNIEYYERELKNLKLLSGKDWLKKRIKIVEEDIIYFTKEYEKELKNFNGKNLWVKQLRDSLLKG